MIEWYRQRHDWFKKTTLRAISVRLEQPLAFVAMLWEAGFNHASKAADRGSVADFCPEDAGLDLGIDELVAARIWEAFTARGMIVRGNIANWESLQPKREDETATERKREQRDRDRERELVELAAQRAKALVLADETAMSRNVTQGHAQSRVEEKIPSPLTPQLKVVASDEKVDSRGASRASARAFSDADRDKLVCARWLEKRLAAGPRILSAERYLAMIAAIPEPGTLSIRQLLASMPRSERGDLERLDREVRRDRRGRVSPHRTAAGERRAA